MATLAICPCCGTDLEADEPVYDGRILSDPHGGCTLDGVPLHLQPNERITLHSLMRAKGKPIRKTAILERMGYEGDANIAEVYISRLRRKLGSHESIETLRGGYVRWHGMGEQVHG